MNTLIYVFLSWMIQIVQGLLIVSPFSYSPRFLQDIPTVNHILHFKRTSLHLNFNDFFNGSLFGNNEDDDDKDEISSISSSRYRMDDSINDHNQDYPGTSNIFKIKLKSMKTGGCRLYLSLYLIGEVNNPEKQTWKMDQTTDGGIDMYYKDASGALMILFQDDSIIVNRLGSSPSMNYLMHESSVLNGLLDQLDDIAFDKNIDENDRLLTLDEDAIDIVRESLSFT